MFFFIEPHQSVVVGQVACKVAESLGNDCALRDRAPGRGQDKMKVHKGISVSPGVAVARAYCIDEVFVGVFTELADGTEVSVEVRRFEEACGKTSIELQSLRAKVAQQIGSEAGEIFAAHELILKDPAFRSKVIHGITERRLTAPASLGQVLDEYSLLFTQTEDAYLRERLVDLQDVIQRLSSHLSEALDPRSNALAGPVIVVARELMPSQALVIGDLDIAGFVTEGGGPTSHAAIIARGRGIPAVTGAEGVRRHIKTGDLVILDAREGHVVTGAGTEEAAAYRKLQREFVDLKDRLASNRDNPAKTADGEFIELLANISSVDDARAASAMGANGVGLYRTEFYFLTHPGLPDEEEQLAAYREVVRASPNRQVTLRTLDLGGDKTTPYLDNHRDANPFMGWRSLRISFEHPEFFLTQVRAAMRAAICPETGRVLPVQLLFPMITTLEEVRKVRALVRRAQRQLQQRCLPAPSLPLGVMIEVPAAAIMIHTIVSEVDYVSIGSNDLTQYLMAADRDNPKVAHLVQPLSPPVLHVLANVIAACRAAGKPVTLCGEMAATPRAVVLLYAMGLRSFSMSPSFIPTIKDVLTNLRQDQAQQIWDRVRQLKTNAQIARLMTEQMSQICPNLSMLDSC